MLHDEYADLVQQGHSVGYVLTRDGFGLGVEREGNFSSDIIVQYLYPRKDCEAYADSYVRRTDFIVKEVREDKNGCYTVVCVLKRNKGRRTFERPLTHRIFDKRPFRDETLRQIIIRCYDLWKARHVPQNPFKGASVVSESSACSFGRDPSSPFNAASATSSTEQDVGPTPSSKGKSTESTEEVVAENEYTLVYEYDYESR